MQQRLRKGGEGMQEDWGADEVVVLVLLVVSGCWVAVDSRC